jgi:hypothetical protein
MILRIMIYMYAVERRDADALNCRRLENEPIDS